MLLSSMSGCGSSPAGGGAGSRYGRTAGSTGHTSGNTRTVVRDLAIPWQHCSGTPLAVRSQQPPCPPTHHHPRAAVGNPDASRSFAGRASDRYAPHGSCDRGGSPGSAGWRRAGPDGGPPVHSRRHSKSGRGRSSCRRTPGPGSERTGTDGQGLPQAQLRPGMDDVRNGWNTAPACVLGTCGARRRFGLGRLGRRRACPADPAGCHRAIVRSIHAATLRSCTRHAGACGYVDNARALPTYPQAQQAAVSVNPIVWSGSLHTRPTSRRRLSASAVAPPHRVTAPSLPGFRQPFTPVTGRLTSAAIDSMLTTAPPLEAPRAGLNARVSASGPK
jgi:hypothetical protein